MKQPESKAGASVLQSPPESHLQLPLESVRDCVSESEMGPAGGGGDRKKRRVRGKGEGLNPSSKGSPVTHSALLQRVKPRSVGQLWFSSQPTGLSRDSLA